MELQQYLRTHANWEAELAEKPYCIRTHHNGDLVILKYTQGESDKANILVKQARGIIFDTAANYKCICYAFNRFYNYGEEQADTIDWSTAIVTEKMDGSICKVYFYNNEWRIATNGTIDAFTATVNGVTTLTYGDLFKQTLTEPWELFCSYLDPSYTYIFELVNSINNTTITYPTNCIYYLGKRSLCEEENFPEFPASTEDGLVPGCESLTFYGGMEALDLCVEKVGQMDGHEHEGLVVCDANCHRIKIKNTDYLKISYMRDSVTEQSLAMVVLQGEQDEFLSYLPKYTDIIRKLEEVIDGLAAKVSEYIADTDFDVERKDFARDMIPTVPTYLRPYLFKVYEGTEMLFMDYLKNLSKATWKTIFEEN